MALYQDLLPERERVARACRVMGKLEVTKSTYGHISLRLQAAGPQGRDLVLIRARGPGESGIRYTGPDDIILVDLDGRKVAGRDDLHVPKEVFIHTELMRARPEVHSVLHAHPATVMLFTICDKPLLPLFGAYDPQALRLVRKELSYYDRSILISDADKGRTLAEVIRASKACMMRGHGITTCGPTVEETTLTAIRLNETAELNYKAYLLGNPRPISDEDLATFEGGKEAEWASYWRYYCRRVEEDGSEDGNEGGNEGGRAP